MNATRTQYQTAAVNGQGLSTRGTRTTFTRAELGLAPMIASVDERLEDIYRNLVRLRMFCSNARLQVDLGTIIERHSGEAECYGEGFSDLRLLAHAVWKETDRNPKAIATLVREAIPGPAPDSPETFELGNARVQLTTLLGSLLGLYREVQDDGMKLRMLDEEECEEREDKTDPSQFQITTIDLESVKRKIISADPKASINKTVVYELENDCEVMFNLSNFEIAGVVTISRHGETVSITGQMNDENSDTINYDLNYFRQGGCLLLGRAELAKLLNCNQSARISRRQMAITMEGELLVITDIGQGPLVTV